MKSNSKKLIRFIKDCLDLAWFGNFILATVAVCLLTYQFTTKEYGKASMEVTLQKADILKEFNSTDQIQDGYLSTKEAIFKYQNKITPQSIISAFIFFLLMECLVILIIFNLRKVFLNLYQSQPFTIEVVISLKKAALFIALILPLNVLKHIYKVAVLNSYFKENQFSVKTSFNFEVLIVAAILFIVAEVFNYGLDLKKENEEFV